MANLRRRGSSLFPGLLLLFVGMMLLLHNYRGLGIVNVLGHWWPLILIFWGGIKLYERMAATRSGDPGAASITSGEVFSPGASQFSRNSGCRRLRQGKYSRSLSGVGK